MDGLKSFFKEALQTGNIKDPEEPLKLNIFLIDTIIISS